MRWNARWLGVAVLGCAVAGIALAVAPRTFSDEGRTTLTKVGDAAPAFRIQTLDGQTLTPASLKGKVTLINFSATWCEPCAAEAPRLEALHERFKDKPLVMVSVGREHTPDQVRAFAAEHRLTFPVAADPSRQAYDLFATQYVPRSYVIGPNGTIVYQCVGFSEPEFAELVRAVETSLEDAR